MGKRISTHVTWVGKVDWELKHFHGNELSTKKGSSYNSYLVRGGEKTALIDTVWGPYDREFVQRLSEEIDLKDIDFVVMNHNESDHSGALVELMRRIPDVPIYCTKKGEGIIRGMYHQDWHFVNVKTGDTLDLGGGVVLTFVEAPMLHWPDTMFTYLGSDKILFSNDGFGQHFTASSGRTTPPRSWRSIWPGPTPTRRTRSPSSTTPCGTRPGTWPRRSAKASARRTRR